MPNSHATVAVFDFGNVLLDWNPRHLYRKLFTDAERMEWFLREVCNTAWILETDRGQPFAEAVAQRIAVHPDLAAEIRAFDERWLETILGPLAESVALLETLRRNGVPVYGITNFSAEKFAVACDVFSFLTAFDGIIVSGRERLLKPDPAIFRLLLDRHGLTAEDCLFIDDVPANVEGARAVGMHGHRFLHPGGLAEELRRHRFPV